MKITHEAEEYTRLFANNKNWLLQRLLFYAEQYNNIDNTFMSEEKWPIPVNRITESLLMAVITFGINPVELSPNENYSNDPVWSFGRDEAMKHRQSGATISMFLTLFKFYRGSCIDLIETSALDIFLKKKFNLFTERCFDRIELGFVEGWTSTNSEFIREELRSMPNNITNEKNIYLTVFDGLFTPIILLDKANRIMNFNHTASKVFPDIVNASELWYNNEVSSAGIKEMGRKLNQFVKLPEEEYLYETSMDTCIGQRYFRVLFKKIPGKNRTFFSTMIVFQDLTEIYEKEENLKIVKSKAEETDRLKTAFLANMSHEIRTPMNAIIGFTELLLNEKHSKNHKNDYLKLIRKSSANLLNLIEDIIDIAKMESKQVKIRYKVCKPFEIMADLKIVFSETLRRFGTDQDVELILNVDKPEENIVVYTDGERLKQVISNLLNNAAKFTSKGFIEYGYRVHDNTRLFFYVRDSGIGVPEDMKDKIFERFYQVDEHLKLNMGGAGLGLAICKNIINLMGGTIWIESKVGEGSVFSFELPYREVPRNVQEKMVQVPTFNKTSYPAWHDKVILIAEDDDINFIYLREILSKTGAKILHAKNGLKAINFTESQEKIDLILMDIKMPEVDGIEATRYISAIRPHIPIVAQTAYALDGDKAKCINAGCCAYITKPVEMGKLFQVIEKYISAKNFINDNHVVKLG